MSKIVWWCVAAFVAYAILNPPGAAAFATGLGHFVEHAAGQLADFTHHVGGN